MRPRSKSQSTFDLFGAVGIKALSLPVSGLLGILALKSLTDQFSTDGLALYGIIIAIPLVVPFADLGLGGAIVEMVASRQQIAPNVFRRKLNKAYGLLSVVAVTLITLSFALYIFESWPYILGLTNEHSNLACFLAVAIFAVCIPASLGYRTLLGLQRNWIVVILQSSAGILGSIAVIIVCALDLPLWVAVCTPQAFVALLSIAAVLISRKALNADVDNVVPQSTASYGLRALAVSNLMIGVSLPIAYQAGRIVLAHRSDVVELATYTAAFALYAPMNSLLTAAGQTLWPRFTRLRAQSSGDLTDAITKMIILFTMAAVIPAGLLVLLGPILSSWITGGENSGSYLLFVIFAILLIANAFNFPMGMSLMGPSSVGFQAKCFAVMAAMTVVLTFVLAPRIGAIAAALAPAIGLAACVMVPSFLRIFVFTNTGPSVGART